MSQVEKLPDDVSEIHLRLPIPGKQDVRILLPVSISPMEWKTVSDYVEEFITVYLMIHGHCPKWSRAIEPPLEPEPAG